MRSLQWKMMYLKWSLFSCSRLLALRQQSVLKGKRWQCSAAPNWNASQGVEKCPAAHPSLCITINNRLRGCYWKVKGWSRIGWLPFEVFFFLPTSVWWYCWGYRESAFHWHQPSWGTQGIPARIRKGAKVETILPCTVQTQWLSSKWSGQSGCLLGWNFKGMGMQLLHPSLIFIICTRHLK